jgi:hypothetical protein
MEKMKRIGQVCWMFSVIILLGMTSISWIQKGRAYNVPETVLLSTETSANTLGAEGVPGVVPPAGPAWATVMTDMDMDAPAAKFYENNQLYGLETDGTIILPQTTAALYDLPLITGVKLPAEFEGDFNTVKGGRIVLDCIGYLRESAPKLFYQISEIHFEPNVGIILYMLEDTKPIVLGKINVVSRITKWQRSYERLADDYHQARYVDLRFDSQVVIKL